MAFSLHIVAGIPGTRVRQSLKQFKEYASKRGTPVVWVSVEEELKRIAAPLVAERWGGLEGSSLGLLLLPIPSLRKIWLDAFEAGSSGECVF